MFRPEAFGDNDDVTPPESSVSEESRLQEAEPTLQSAEAFEHELEAKMKADLELMAGIFDSFDEIARLATSTEQKKKLNSLREILSQVGKGAVQGLIEGVVISSIVMPLIKAAQFANEYEKMHPPISAELNPDTKSLEYTHPDSETTHLISVLAGRETLSEEEQLISYRAKLKVLAREYNFVLPPDFDTYTIKQIDSTMIPLLQTVNPQWEPGDLVNSFYFHMGTDKIRLEPEEQEAIYDFMWELEQECGNPKIRLTEIADPIRGANPSATGIRPFYDHSTNTIYLQTDLFCNRTEVVEDKPITSTIAELSHAAQFSKTPLKAYAQSGLSIVRIFAKAGHDPAKWHAAQLEEYDIKGSLEHDAHEVIEPPLNARYVDMINGLDQTK